MHASWGNDMHRGGISVGLAMSITLVGVSLPALAQPVAQMQVDSSGPSDGETKPATGFSVRKEDQKVTDALDEFDRYCGKESWEKAFASLSTAADMPAKGLIPAKNGFLIPTRLRIRRALCSLSPAGRSAFRLFNDAKAKSDLDKIGDALKPEQLTALRKLTDQYFISSVGDRAADKLADALFESGDFAAAAGYWQAILTDYPDTTLSPLRLLTKRAVASLRAGDMPSFQSALATIRDRYAGQAVHIAGKDVIATDYLAEMAAAPTTNPTTTPATAPTTSSSLVDSAEAPANLPASPAPAWQVPLEDEELHMMIQQQMQNMGWGNMASGSLGGPPSVDVDDKRLYANWLGICFAVDLRTGKMLWRTDKFEQQPQHIQMMVQQGQDGACDAAIAAGDRVWFVRRDPKRQDYNAPNQLICLAADTGKVVWSSENLSFFKEWTFNGPPLLNGQTLLAVAHPQNNQDISLMAMSVKDGSQQWTLPLGTPTLTQNFRGMQVSPLHRLLLDNGKLYVLTNNGALLCIDLASHTLEWAFTYDAKLNANDGRFGFNPYNQQPKTDMPGAIISSGGTLFIKETGGNTIYAIDPTVPSLKWKRPIDGDETVIRADNAGLLTLGADLGYIDLATREMKWAAQIPAQNVSLRPLLGADHLLMFVSRGIFDFDSSTGDTRQIFRGLDRDSGGGTLWRTADKIITVSNRAITAYPIE